MVGWIALRLLIAKIAARMEEHFSNRDQTFFGVLVFGISIYYILARFSTWIYDGFKTPQK